SSLRRQPVILGLSVASQNPHGASYSFRYTKSACGCTPHGVWTLRLAFLVVHTGDMKKLTREEKRQLKLQKHQNFLAEQVQRKRDKKARKKYEKDMHSGKNTYGHEA